MLFLVGIGLALAAVGVFWLSIGLQAGIGSDILLAMGGLSAAMGFGLIMIVAYNKDSIPSDAIEDESYSEQDALTYAFRKLRKRS